MSAQRDIEGSLHAPANRRDLRTLLGQLIEEEEGPNFVTATKNNWRHQPVAAVCTRSGQLLPSALLVRPSGWLCMTAVCGIGRGSLPHQLPRAAGILPGMRALKTCGLGSLSMAQCCGITSSVHRKACNLPYLSLWTASTRAAHRVSIARARSCSRTGK